MATPTDDEEQVKDPQEEAVAEAPQASGQDQQSQDEPRETSAYQLGFGERFSAAPTPNGTVVLDYVVVAGEKYTSGVTVRARRGDRITVYGGGPGFLYLDRLGILHEGSDVVIPIPQSGVAFTEHSASFTLPKFQEQGKLFWVVLFDSKGVLRPVIVKKAFRYSAPDQAKGEEKEGRRTSTNEQSEGGTETAAGKDAGSAAGGMAGVAASLSPIKILMESTEAALSGAVHTFGSQGAQASASPAPTQKAAKTSRRINISSGTQRSGLQDIELEVEDEEGSAESEEETQTVQQVAQAEAASEMAVEATQSVEQAATAEADVSAEEVRNLERTAQVEAEAVSEESAEATASVAAEAAVTANVSGAVSPSGQERTTVEAVGQQAAGISSPSGSEAVVKTTAMQGARSASADVPTGAETQRSVVSGAVTGDMPVGVQETVIKKPAGGPQSEEVVQEVAFGSPAVTEVANTLVGNRPNGVLATKKRTAPTAQGTAGQVNQVQAPAVSRAVEGVLRRQKQKQPSPQQGRLVSAAPGVQSPAEGLDAATSHPSSSRKPESGQVPAPVPEDGNIHPPLADPGSKVPRGMELQFSKLKDNDARLKSGVGGVRPISDVVLTKPGRAIGNTALERPIQDAQTEPGATPAGEQKQELEEKDPGLRAEAPLPVQEPPVGRQNPPDKPAEAQQQAPEVPEEVPDMEIGGVRSTALNKQSALKKAAAEINMLLDKVLMQGVMWVWGGALPSFGLTIVAGAIIGDFLWIFKDAIIRKIIATNPLTKISSSLKGAENEVARMVKISGKVKLNIAAMNAAILLLILAVMIFFLALFYGACNSVYTLPVRMMTAMGDYCAALNQTGFLSSVNNRVNDTLGMPQGGPIATVQWNGKIRQYANQHGIDPCVLTVVLQKESRGGDPRAIGHDGHLASGDPPNFNDPVRLGLDWNYSHGIGLTQWTIFPETGRSRWMDRSTPSRYMFGRWYTVQDFLDPDTSLELTARSFAGSIQQYGLRDAFRRYNGSGPRAEAYADSSMKLYDLCKNTVPPGPAQ